MYGLTDKIVLKTVTKTTKVLVCRHKTRHVCKKLSAAQTTETFDFSIGSVHKTWSAYVKHTKRGLPVTWWLFSCNGSAYGATVQAFVSLNLKAKF